MTTGDPVRRRSAIAAVTRLARRQEGVFTRRQARGLGVSAAMVRHRISSGEWLPYRGVLRLGATPDGDSPRAAAALVRGGPGTVLTGTAAMRLYGMVGSAPVPTVCLPPDRNLRIPESVVLRERHVSQGPLFAGGFRVAEPHRAVIDALRVMPPEQSLDLADRVGSGDLDVARVIREWLDEHPGSRGNAQLRDLVPALSDGARSRAERRLHRILRAAGIRGWVANLPVHDAAGLIGLVDVGFERERVAIEIDGRAYHSDAARFQRDRTRQNRLVRAGWTVLRFTWHDLARDPAAVLGTVRSVLDRYRRRPA